MRLIEKHVGETPLSALKRLRVNEHIPESVRLSYAGRLDPMASGVLLVLEGDECKDQKRFQGLDKTYTVEVLLGITSDTGDILGLVGEHAQTAVTREALDTAAATLVGSYAAPYPDYSSRTVNGKPLFQWTLEGRRDEIEAPLQHGTIRALAISAMTKLPTAKLHTIITDKLSLTPLTTDPRKALGRNFRIDAVRASWYTLFSTTPCDAFVVVRFTATTSSGVYMRTLADDLAQRVGARGLALSIHRDAIFLEGRALQ